MRFSIYRYNPDTDAEPRMQDYDISLLSRPTVCCLMR